MHARANAKSSQKGIYIAHLKMEKAPMSVGASLESFGQLEN